MTTLPISQRTHVPRRSAPPGQSAFTLRRGNAPPVPSSSTPGAPFWLTRRLLVETVAPGQHLAFNPLSGAVDLLDDVELARITALQQGKQASMCDDTVALLRARRYLFDTPAEEEALLEGAVAGAWKRMQAAQPQAYTVCPTLACNLACAYCFEGDSLTDKKQGVMTETQVDALFASIATLCAQAAAAGQASPYAPWIGLFGGEPLLPSTQKCVAHILRHAAAGGFLVGATTNGVNVTRFESILREYADILTTFQVTLDGPKALHDSRRHRLGGQGTFDEIVRGVDLLLSLGIDVDLRVNVDGQNLSALPELVDFMDERGWTGQEGFQMALAPVTDHQPDKPHHPDKPHQPESNGCGSKAGHVLSEMRMAQDVMALMKAHPRLGEVCHMGFLRHLDYLVSVLEPEKMHGKDKNGRGTRPGPRYWYCEASTDRQYVFTPEGLIYSCTEAVGKPKHAIGQCAPELELWQEQAGQWQGRTILSHPQCRACSISTLCGGGCHFAAREKERASEQQTAGTLMQIGLPGKKTTSSESLTHIARRTEPFCNAAEDTVRAYLRHVGKGLLASQDESAWQAG